MPTMNGDCLVCSHSQADHQAVPGSCVGGEGRCQCHGYNPDTHPAQRLAERHAREAQAAAQPT